jgi:regulator of PEP synthase PpsR (kinase-PPPase family)
MHGHNTIILISDHTGITVETLLRSLLSQFDEVPAERLFRPFTNTPEKMAQVVREINAAAEVDGKPPLVYSSIVDTALRKQLKKCDGKVFDIFDELLPIMSETLHIKSGHHIGRTHGMGDQGTYDKRVSAVNFALNFDDGVRVKDLDQADLILLGVSRSGKTPTCLYLAMQYAVLAANYPLINDDLDTDKLPKVLQAHRHKIIGLTITPDRLHSIREERRPGSGYASLNQCRREISAAEAMFAAQRIQTLDSTYYSIEELAVEIMQLTHMERAP